MSKCCTASANRHKWTTNDDCELLIYLAHELRKEHDVCTGGLRMWEEHSKKAHVSAAACQTRFRRIICPNLHTYPISGEDMLFIYKKLRIPIEHQYIVPLLEQKFSCEIVIRHRTSTIRSYKFLNNDEKQQRERERRSIRYPTRVSRRQAFEEGKRDDHSRNGTEEYAETVDKRYGIHREKTLQERVVERRQEVKSEKMYAEKYFYGELKTITAVRRISMGSQTNETYKKDSSEQFPSTSTTVENCADESKQEETSWPCSMKTAAEAECKSTQQAALLKRISLPNSTPSMVAEITHADLLSMFGISCISEPQMSRISQLLKVLKRFFDLYQPCPNDIRSEAFALSEKVATGELNVDEYAAEFCAVFKTKLHSAFVSFLKKHMPFIREVRSQSTIKTPKTSSSPSTQIHLNTSIFRKPHSQKINNLEDHRNDIFTEDKHPRDCTLDSETEQEPRQQGILANNLQPFVMRSTCQQPWHTINDFMLRSQWIESSWNVLRPNFGDSDFKELIFLELRTAEVRCYTMCKTKTAYEDSRQPETQDIMKKFSSNATQ